MFRHAMIAVDLDSHGPLLECAPDLATWGIGKVTVVHAIKVGYAQGPDPDQERHYRSMLDTRAEPLRAQGLTVELDVSTAGDVGDALAAKATRTGADLLVVGNRSHNVIERLFLGSVARKVLRRSEVPVLIEWIEPAADNANRCTLTCGQTLRHALAATDLTAASHGVHDVAVALAARGARVDILHVATPDDSARFAEWPAMARAALAEVSRRIAEAGGKGDTLIEQGEPRETILDIAAERNASLLIVGKAGHGKSGNPALGRTARALSEQAGRPVLMIPTS